MITLASLNTNHGEVGAIVSEGGNGYGYLQPVSSDKITGLYGRLVRKPDPANICH